VSAGRGDFEHSDRLALLPIERETASKHQPVADITATTKRPK
jgi:hypothetical protein